MERNIPIMPLALPLILSSKNPLTKLPSESEPTRASTLAAPEMALSFFCALFGAFPIFACRTKGANARNAPSLVVSLIQRERQIKVRAADYSQQALPSDHDDEAAEDPAHQPKGPITNGFKQMRDRNDLGQ